MNDVEPVPPRMSLLRRVASLRFVFLPTRRVFTEIYKNNLFGGAESVSGPGSSVRGAQSLLTEIPSLLREFGVRSLVDAPCGDFNWMQQIVYEELDYYGIDIVEELIANNTRRHSRRNVRFVCRDVTRESVPQADLILCRDLVVHLPWQDALQAFKRFKESGATFLLTTTHPNSGHNRNTRIMGKWRPVNLQAHPFNFPQPTRIIEEDDRLDPGKVLALWRLRDIQPRVGVSGQT